MNNPRPARSWSKSPLVVKKGSKIRGLISGGTVKACMGKAVPLDSAGNFPVYPQFPECPDTFVPFAYTVMKAGATAALAVTPGTTNWNATGFTNASQDVMVLPNRPQLVAIVCGACAQRARDNKMLDGEIT